MNAESDPRRDGDLFRLYNARFSAEAWQSGSWQDAFVEQASEAGGDAWSAQASGHGNGDRELFGGPGADLFGSGASAWSAGDFASPFDGPAGGPGAGPPSGSMPSISQSMPPVSQSMPPGSIPSGSMSPGSGSPGSGSPGSGSMPAISGSMSAMGGRQPEEAEETQDAGSLVRPYARTRGRTRANYDLAIETLVSTSEHGRTQSHPTTPEHRSICGLCMEARSVAEIAAHLRLPLGVVRVLIGDMAGLGLVLIHDSGTVVGDRPSMEFLERVLSGLRRL